MPYNLCLEEKVVVLLRSPDRFLSSYHINFNLFHLHRIAEHGPGGSSTGVLPCYPMSASIQAGPWALDGLLGKLNTNVGPWDRRVGSCTSPLDDSFSHQEIFRKLPLCCAAE